MAEITGDLHATVYVKPQKRQARIVKIVQGHVEFDPTSKPPADAKGYASFSSDATALAECLRRLSDIFPDRNFLLVSTPQKLNRFVVKNDAGEAMYMAMDMTNWQIMSDGDDEYLIKVLGALVLALQENRRLKYRETDDGKQFNTTFGSLPDVPEEGDPPTKFEEMINAEESKDGS